MSRPKDFSSVAPGYRRLWEDMRVNSSSLAAVDKVAKGIIASKPRYQVIEAKTGVPWFFIAALHQRESSRNFSTYLGNGQSLKRKTTIVPVGRGPFKTFEEGAIDALKLVGLTSVKEWPIERIGYEFEKWNGWGYFGRINSPYLWAGSNNYVKGKYVADHVFNPNAVDQQLGTMPIVARLAALDSDVRQKIAEKPLSVTPK